MAEQLGASTRTVDVFSAQALDDIAGCDAFMWRCGPSANPRLLAKRFCFAVERGLNIPVFPSLQTAWHFEDKIVQHYYLSAAGIPTPRTDVFWSRAQAVEFCKAASYPLVIKLSSGYQGRNVRLASNASEAIYYVDQLFGGGLTSLGYKPASSVRMLLRRLRLAVEIGRGRHPNSPSSEAELEHGYFLAQEFLPGNDWDTRVTVIGSRAFAFRRRNRPDDFRASGSGCIDWDPSKIDLRAVRLAFRVAEHTQAQTVAVDIIYRDNEPVILELTLAFASWAVRDCPGHWRLQGSSAEGELLWIDGHMRPEDAIFVDFLGRISGDSPDILHTRLQEKRSEAPADE